VRPGGASDGIRPTAIAAQVLHTLNDPKNMRVVRGGMAAQNFQCPLDLPLAVM
jgi:hypothetical protein